MPPGVVGLQMNIEDIGPKMWMPEQICSLDMEKGYLSLLRNSCAFTNTKHINGTYAWSNLWIFPKHTLDEPTAERKGYDLLLSRNQNLNMNDSGNDLQWTSIHGWKRRHD